MPVILHDYHCVIRLPLALRWHVSAPCLLAKSADSNSRCAAYCGDNGSVDRRIASHPDGFVHRCPFGHWKIALPLARDGHLGGILFAGPLTAPLEAPERTGEWLDHCRSVLVAVVHEIARLVEPGEWSRSDADRRRAILDFLSYRFDGPARLEDLARRLHLSPSRTRHLVAELFGKPFRTLALELRLKGAASLLGQTQLPLADIALRMGFCDASHFSNAFRRQFGMSPRRYRGDAQVGP